jgi:hypothetical protein
MKIATCIADLEDYIVAESESRPLLAGEQIANWTNGEPIHIRGKWRGKGYFAPLCVRWSAGDGKGMFGKGLAGYSGKPITPEKINHLPFVK